MMLRFIVTLAFLLPRQASDAEQVGVIVVGDTAVLPQVAAQLETWLSDHGHTVMKSALATARFSSSGRLKLTSRPSGAKVVIDGAAVGVTPIEHDLSPGNHQVTISADEHEMETRTVPIRAGETTTLDVPLAPTRDDRSGSRPLLPAAIALGVVLVMATGGVLVAVDQDMGPNEPLHIRNTAPLGVKLLAAVHFDDRCDFSNVDLASTNWRRATIADCSFAGRTLPARGSCDLRRMRSTLRGFERSQTRREGRVARTVWRNHAGIL